MPADLQIDRIECTPNPINQSGGETPMVTVSLTNIGDEAAPANVMATLDHSGDSASGSDDVNPGEMNTFIMAFGNTDFASLEPGSYNVTVYVEGGNQTQQGSCGWEVQ